MSTTTTPTAKCPDCRVGKCSGCAGWALDARDQETDCPCECRTGAAK